MISVQCEILNPSFQTGSWDPDLISIQCACINPNLSCSQLYRRLCIFLFFWSFDSPRRTVRNSAKKYYFNYGCGDNTIINASPTTEGISNTITFYQKLNIGKKKRTKILCLLPCLLTFAEEVWRACRASKAIFTREAMCWTEQNYLCWTQT
jgi:hypothetical protein